MPAYDHEKGSGTKIATWSSELRRIGAAANSAAACPPKGASHGFWQDFTTASPAGKRRTDARSSRSACVPPPRPTPPSASSMSARATTTATTRRTPQGAAALKKMPGVKVVEEEKVPETDAVEKTMESMINLDGATLLFPTSFGYYNPHMLKMAQKFPKLRFEHCGGLWSDKDPKNAGSYFGYIDEAPVHLRHRRRLYDQERQARLRRRQADPAGAAQHQRLHAGRQARQSEGHHAGDLHRRLVDAGQGGRSHQQPDRPGRRRPHLPRRRPEDDGRERRAPRRDGLRLSRQPGAAGAEGLSHRRRVELGSALSEASSR